MDENIDVNIEVPTETSNNIESALNSVYGNCRLLDNGVYYARAENGNEIFVPANTSGNFDLYACFPGSGGSGAKYNDSARATQVGDNDAKMVWNQYHSENPPNYVTVLSAGCFDPNDMLTTADTFLGISYHESAFPFSYCSIELYQIF